MIDCGGKIKPSDFHAQWHINVSFSLSLSLFIFLYLFFFFTIYGVVVAGSRGDIYFWRVGLGVIGLKRYTFFFWESLGSRRY